jgi:hypothetical protein
MTFRSDGVGTILLLILREGVSAVHTMIYGIRTAQDELYGLNYQS